MHNTKLVDQLIKDAQKSIINTFIIDLPVDISTKYKENIKKIQENNIEYIPRVVVFPYGANEKQVTDPTIWKKYWPRIEKAITELNAKSVQLDYIRYSYKGQRDPKKVQNIQSIIKWYQNKIHKLGAELEITVFGITAFHPSHYVGQDLEVFSHAADVIAPMMYPSHFEPYMKHAKDPKSIVSDALKKANEKAGNRAKIIPFLESYNYRFPMNEKQRINYTIQQIKAARENKTSGWYFWSVSNYYEILFKALEKLNDTKSHVNTLNPNPEMSFVKKDHQTHAPTKP